MRIDCHPRPPANRSAWGPKYRWLFAVLALPFLALASPGPGPGLGAAPSTNRHAGPAPSIPVRDGSNIRFGLVLVNPSTRSASLPGRVNMDRGVIEYVLVTDYGKTHESLFVSDAAPADLQAALLLLGAKPSGIASITNQGLPSAVASNLVEIEASWTRHDVAVRRPLHELIDLATGDPSHSVTGHLAAGRWLFNGSMITAEGFAAHFEGSMVSLIRDPTAVINNPRPDLDEDDIHVPAGNRVPTNGTPITLHFMVPAPRS